MRIAHDTSAAASLWRQRERLGDLESYQAPRKTDSAQWEEDTAGALAGTEALLDALGESNPILQDLLKTAKDEIYTAGLEGRRLMQRKEYNVRMTDSLITAEIMEFYGKGGIPGVTVASVRKIKPSIHTPFRLTLARARAQCEALCEATAQVDTAKPSERCRAFAHKRAAPFSYVDKTGWCYLLQVHALHLFHQFSGSRLPLVCSECGRVQD